MHQQTFPRFKNIHQGCDIVIFASGPSAAQYKVIEGAIHIGVNRSFISAPVDLDYIFLQDYSGQTPNYIKELNNYKPKSCTKFYGLTTEWEESINRVVPESDTIEAGALRYRTDWAKVRGFKSRFVYDLSSQPLGCFGTIVFPALQFALWTNPAKIYLVGCDCSTAGYSYDKSEKNYLIPDEIVDSYRKFAIFAKKYYPATEIVSINPVGLKGVFNELYTK